MLTIPKSHNLDINVENMTVEVEDLDGLLKIGSTGGKLKAKKLKELEASLLFGSLDIEEVKKATVNAHVSTIKIGKIEELKIGSTQIGIEQALGTLFFRRLNDLSSQNTYTIDTVHVLKIEESTNDNFHLGEVGNLGKINIRCNQCEVKFND